MQSAGRQKAPPAFARSQIWTQPEMSRQIRAFATHRLCAAHITARGRLFGLLSEIENQAGGPRSVWEEKPEDTKTTAGIWKAPCIARF